MKKITAGICALAMAAMPTLTAFAAPSIGSEGPKDPVAVSGIGDGLNLVIQPVETELYKNQDIAEVVDTFNDVDSSKTVLNVHNDVLLQMSSETQLVSGELEDGEKIVVKNIDLVDYNSVPLNSLAAEYNNLFNTFERAEDENGVFITDEDGNYVYAPTGRTVTDLLYDVFFISAAEPVVTAGDLGENEIIRLVNANIDRYDSEVLQDVVKDFNSSRKELSVQDAAKKLGVDLEQEILSNRENPVALDEYQPLTYFMDLTIERDKEDADETEPERELTFEGGSEYTVRVSIQSVIGQKAEDLIVMFVDPKTGEVSFLEPDSFDEETGEIEVTVPCLGTYAILTKGEVPERTAVTNKDTVICPDDYNAVAPFADLLIENDEDLYIRETGEFVLTIQCDAIKDMDMEDLLIMSLDPDSNAVSYIEPEEYDPETGEITAAYEHLGPVLFMTRSELEEEPYRTNKDNVVLPQEYETLMPFSDLALETSETEITYDMEGKPVVRFICELTKGMDPDCLLIMTINQETKERNYIEIDEFDELKGEITATFEHLGPFMIVTRLEPLQEEAYQAEEETAEETESEE